MDTGTIDDIPKARSEPRKGYWWRVLRPMFWWFLSVLVLLAIHQHQVWIERTRLYCSVTMYQTNAVNDAVGTLDSRQIHVGDRIPLGRHEFKITEPKAVTFTTNFFAWYGPHDFGKIDLKRAMGTLNISSVPAARLITITGPEFSMTLYDSSGTNMTVPTDQYRVDAQYLHWSQRQNVTVLADTPANCTLAPQLGALRLTCNHDGATYLLQLSDGQKVDGGDVPATVTQLPAGKYQLTVRYHQKQMQKSIEVESDMTNDVPVEFVLGAVRLESVPDGASVYAPNGNYLGQTPLDLADVTPETVQFKLSLQNYEPVTLPVDVVADTTVTVRTNLLSVRYGQAMQEARQDENAGNYKGVLEAVGEVLGLKPDDPEALALQVKATEQLTAARQKADVEQQKLNMERQQTEAARQQADAQAKVEKERLERLNGPHDYFVKLMSETPNSAYCVEQDLKVNGNAADVRAKIVDALSKSLLLKFLIEQNEEPFPGGFFIRAKLPMMDGYRRCYIVGGQTTDGEVTILFKVLEYTWPQDLMLSALVNKPTDDKAIPIYGSFLTTGEKESRRELGIKIVTERIQQATTQTKSK